MIICKYLEEKTIQILCKYNDQWICYWIMSSFCILSYLVNCKEEVQCIGIWRWHGEWHWCCYWHPSCWWWYWRQLPAEFPITTYHIFQYLFNITTKSEIIQSIHSSCSLLTISITIFIVITNHCFRYTLSATYHNVSMTKLNWTTVEYQDMRPNYGWPGRLGHLLKLCNTGQSGNLSVRVHNFVRFCHILICLLIWNKQVINYLKHNL